MGVFEAEDTHYRTISILSQCWNDLATVYLGKHVPSGKMVAVKRFNMDRTKEEAGLVQVLKCDLVLKQLYERDLPGWVRLYRQVGPP